MRRVLPFTAAFLLLAAIFAFKAPTGVAAQAAACEYVLGFAALHELIPDRVGECRGNVFYDPNSGDGLQYTSAWHGHGGLLVWRKADNWTAFTDGHRTWINGPLGLQQRLNTQRFSWEWNPDRMELLPPPVPGERCHTGALSLSLAGMDAGAGNVVATFLLTNESGVTCTFHGFPGAQLLDGANNPLPTRTVWGGGWMQSEPGPRPVAVEPGGAAAFKLHWGQVEVGSETSCPTASRLAVTPPDEWAPLIVDATIRACDGGRLNVSAVQPNK